MPSVAPCRHLRVGRAGFYRRMVRVATTSTDTAAVSRDELLRRASALVPVLQERAPHTEQLRQVPPETVRDLVASGLIRVGNPDRYGGYGLDLDMAHEVGWELSRGCGSTGWCYSLWTVHNWWLGHFPEQ